MITALNSEQTVQAAFLAPFDWLALLFLARALSLNRVNFV
jgi:hypothetical protein